MEDEYDERQQRRKVIDIIEARIADDIAVHEDRVNQIRGTKHRHEIDIGQIDSASNEYMQSQKNMRAVRRDILSLNADVNDVILYN